MEDGDQDDSATALREAMEEIGLDSELVKIVANLEAFDSLVLFFFQFCLLFRCPKSEFINATDAERA